MRLYNIAVTLNDSAAYTIGTFCIFLSVAAARVAWQWRKEQLLVRDRKQRVSNSSRNSANRSAYSKLIDDKMDMDPPTYMATMDAAASTSNINGIKKWFRIFRNKREDEAKVYPRDIDESSVTKPANGQILRTSELRRRSAATSSSRTSSAVAGAVAGDGGVADRQKLIRDHMQGSIELFDAIAARKRAREEELLQQLEYGN